ncbi:hypothetical protein Clacol_009430 [Clathrus columnatus]|uniref:Uncharacterized protein n=1 Tax=Clathrus columnatus TaxID=1419009 RepID=A0AAV5AQT1_9AGAM|nr:hypothetical protein Clacol_009430 [Clathrus columnatus]
MTSFDQNRGKWREDHKVPGRFIRECVSAEIMLDIWNTQYHGDGNMFLGLYIKLANSFGASEFMTYLREAWKSLRWEIPTIALQVYHVPVKRDSLPKPYMVYDVAKSSSEADDWAKTTAFLMEGYKDLDDLRYHIGQNPLPPTDFVPQTFVYALQTSPDSFGILIHTSHVISDGNAVRIVGNRLLYHLANYIGDPGYQKLESKKIRWGSESVNLVPVISDVIQNYEPAVKDSSGNIIKEEIPGEIREGPEYDKTLAEVMDGLNKGSTLAHPFKSIIYPIFNVQKQNPRSRRVYYTFTLEESERIKAACKPTRSMPEKLTCLNLKETVNGALGLVTILDNPPQKDSDAMIFFWGVVDPRKKLIPRYHNYPCFALGMSALLLPVSLYETFSHEDRRTLVLEFAKATREEYNKQAQYPSLTSVLDEEVDRMLQGPPPPPWCGPRYSADGRGSNYLSPSHEVNGRKIIEVSDFFIAVNRCDPGPCFRATEWNGRIMLSADYNELAVETKVAQRWMDLWRKLVLFL